MSGEGHEMQCETLLVKRDREVMTVTLNRPEKLNAMNDVMVDELIRVFSDLRSDTTTRFLILKGAGETFTSGVDLASALQKVKTEAVAPYEVARSQQLRGHDLMQTLERLEQVTIAAINGRCLGAGFAIALACDFRILSDDAALGLPEAHVGIFFTWGCTPRLVRLVGLSRAKELIMTCNEIGASRALEWGLANRVVPRNELHACATEFIAQIAKQGPLAVRLTKKIANAAALSNIGDLWLCEPELVERVFASDEPIEGFNAFLEKREPKFRP
ncbi:MAG: enoyl-CoA hydratase-related protein [Candidatus Abyssubacteria bacterium]